MKQLDYYRIQVIDKEKRTDEYLTDIAIWPSNGTYEICTSDEEAASLDYMIEVYEVFEDRDEAIERAEEALKLRPELICQIVNRRYKDNLIATDVKRANGDWENMHEAATYMDKEIREGLHRSFKYHNETDFMRAYDEMHRIKWGEEFIIG